MLSFSSKLFIPLVYLFITISSLVESHELTFNRRDHGTKRFLKNRSLPDVRDLPLVVNVAALPSASSDSQIATSIISQSTASVTSPTTRQSSSSASTSAISTSTGAASTIASSQSTSSFASSSTSSSSATNTSASSTSASSTSQTSANMNLTPITVIPTAASVVPSTITSTQSLSATTSSTAAPQAQSASSKTKSTTVTILIAIAASVGGIAILWTIFRKWKLSSSKEFDRRLNPITDWQPTNGEDDLIPTLRRVPSSSSSFHSGGGSGDGHTHFRSADLASLDHDFTAGPAPIGGYADLAPASNTNLSMQHTLGRGPSFNPAPIGGYADLAPASNTNPSMQQTLGRGPSFNYGYGVPLHHQTGAYDGSAGY